MKKTNYTKTEKRFSFSTFTRCFSLALIFGALSSTGLKAQTQVFLDQFNAGLTATAAIALPSTEGTPAISHKSGTGSVGSFSYSYKNSTDMILQIGANAATGSSFIYFDNSGFSTPYSASAGLKATGSLITWYINLKTYNTHATNYRSVVVLGCSNSDFNNASATGYAVYCSKSTAGKVSLARFSGGVLGASVTDVIAESTSYTANNYLSIKVTYDPNTDNWSLYVRNDGTAAFALPWTGTLTQQGSTVVDATYTAAADNLKYSGYYFKHSNGATSSYKTFFDNFKVAVDVPVTFTTGWPVADSPTSNSFTVKTKTNVPATTYYVVMAKDAAAPTTAQVKAGNDNLDATALASGSIASAAGETEYTSAAGGALTSSTDYDVYFVAQDAGGGNLQASPVKVTVSTTFATAVDFVNSDLNAYVSNGKLVIYGGDVYNTVGMKVASVKTSQKTELSLRPGIYVVKSNAGTQKVMIK